ncbi:MAG: hypothetical protein ACFHWX_13260 [Bacteroidota bacterium]
MNSFFKAELELIPTDRKLFFHIHVPKTGGTTFWQILKSNFEILSADYSTGGLPDKYSQDQMGKILYLWRSDCFTAHNYSISNLPFERYPNLRAFSFVRSPVEKVISSYYFLRGRRATPDWHLSRRMMLKDILSTYQDGYSDPLLFDGPQTDFIIGDSKSTLELVEKYIEAKQFHLFPMERFDDAMICLEKLYPQDFKDCSYGNRSNVSKRDQEVTDEIISRIEQLPWIEKDRNLHELSIQYLDSLIVELFPDKQDLEKARSDFQLRCEAKKASLENKKSATIKKLSFTQRVKSAGRILLKGY